MIKRLTQFTLNNSVLLILGAVTALIWANVEAEGYQRFIHLRLLGADLRFLTNEILMAFFFALAGKEIWEAMLPRGPLHEPRKSIAPLAATVGGMAVPALLYVLGAGLLGQSHELNRGWAIPCATDIAFSFMVARLVFGRRHPAIPFLLLLAIGDDFGGLLILAAFYPAASLRPFWLLLPALAVALGLALRARNVKGWWWYFLGPGALSWMGFHGAGLQPALGLLPIIPTLPYCADDAEQDDVLTPKTRHALHLFEAHVRTPVELILGLFGLVNAGVSFKAGGPATGLVMTGLVLGKPLGIWLAGALAARTFRCGLPEGMNLKDLLVLGFVAGIGFTVALFVAQVAFPDGAAQDAARMGALASLFAAAPALVAAKLLGVQRRRARNPRTRGAQEATPRPSPGRERDRRMNAAPPTPSGLPPLTGGTVSFSKNGRVIVSEVRVARGFMERLLGLMGRRALAEGQGLYFPRCRSLHTCFMRFALDLVFLDEERRVVRIRRKVGPWRAAQGPSTADSVLEVASGWLSESALREGDAVEMSPKG